MPDGSFWLGRVDSHKKIQIHFLKDCKVGQTRFIEEKSSLIDQGSSFLKVGCWESILRLIDFKDFCLEIDIYNGIIV